MARSTTTTTTTATTWPTASDFGSRIRGERERLKLTTESCAQQLGISHATYLRMEKETPLTGSTLAQMVRGLGYRLKSLIPEAFAVNTTVRAVSRKATAKPAATTRKAMKPAASASSSRPRAKAGAR
jgi:transcriptional regulator with XRE-family HTH domain